MNYYNEFEPSAAAWLRELIKAGHIPAGDVDTRSIEDVKPGDLRGYRQCHFFAGIGGWSLALALAGWPVDQPVWTGSCPCQPFSAAGKGAGFDDQRHLWPAWFHLIRECRPAAIFGEQVASAAVGPWLDLVQADMEGVDYAFGSVAFPAASVGAPHIRDRTYWVAHVDGGSFGLGYTNGKSSERRAGGVLGAQASQHGARLEVDGFEPDRSEHAGEGMGERPGPVNGYWRAADWLGCRDGKWRPVEPGTFPLVDGVSGRLAVVRPGLGGHAEVAEEDVRWISRTAALRGAGNAIVPQQAAEFIRAADGVIECLLPS